MPVNELNTQASAVAVSAAELVTVVAADPAMLAVADAVVVEDAMGAAMPEAATGRAGIEAGMLPRLAAGNAACRGKERGSSGSACNDHAMQYHYHSVYEVHII